MFHLDVDSLLELREGMSGWRCTFWTVERVTSCWNPLSGLRFARFVFRGGCQYSLGELLYSNEASIATIDPVIFVILENALIHVTRLLTSIIFRNFQITRCAPSYKLMIQFAIEQPRSATIYR